MTVRIFYDTEFVEDGKTIDLLSIGMVTGDDRDPYYAVNLSADWEAARAHPWVGPNVVAHIPLTIAEDGRPVPDGRRVRARTHDEIATEVRRWLEQRREAVELWSWYGSYDHVALAQLWGPMVNRPAVMPMVTYDLRQEAARLGVRVPEFKPAKGPEHHALNDARVHREMYAWLHRQEAVAAARGRLRAWLD